MDEQQRKLLLWLRLEQRVRPSLTLSAKDARSGPRWALCAQKFLAVLWFDARTFFGVHWMQIFEHPKHAVNAEPIDDDAPNKTKHCDDLFRCCIEMMYIQITLNSGCARS